MNSFKNDFDEKRKHFTIFTTIENGIQWNTTLKKIENVRKNNYFSGKQNLWRKEGSLKEKVLITVHILIIISTYAY